MKAGGWLQLGRRTHCRSQLVDDLFQTVVPVIAAFRLLQGAQHEGRFTSQSQSYQMAEV